MTGRSSHPSPSAVQQFGACDKSDHRCGTAPVTQRTSVAISPLLWPLLAHLGWTTGLEPATTGTTSRGSTN